MREQRRTSGFTPSNDAIGFVYATIGAIYSVDFAMVAVTTWQQFEDARALKYAESHAVAALLRFLPGLPATELDEA